MQIQLSQDELKDAVRLYVTTELKMDLAGKSLTTTFTATRGDAGIVTNLSIQKTGAQGDVEIPGFTNATDEEIAAASAPAAAEVVTDTKPATTAKATKAAPEKGAVAPVTAATLAPATETTAAPAAEVAAETGEAKEDSVVADEAAAAVVEDGAAPKTTTSLFG